MSDAINKQTIDAVWRRFKRRMAEYDQHPRVRFQCKPVAPERERIWEYDIHIEGRIIGSGESCNRFEALYLAVIAASDTELRFSYSLARRLKAEVWRATALSGQTRAVIRTTREEFRERQRQLAMETFYRLPAHERPADICDLRPSNDAAADLIAVTPSGREILIRLFNPMPNTRPQHPRGRGLGRVHPVSVHSEDGTDLCHAIAAAARQHR